MVCSADQRNVNFYTIFVFLILFLKLFVMQVAGVRWGEGVVARPSHLHWAGVHDLPAQQAAALPLCPPPAPPPRLLLAQRQDNSHHLDSCQEDPEQAGQVYRQTSSLVLDSDRQVKARYRTSTDRLTSSTYADKDR